MLPICTVRTRIELRVTDKCETLVSNHNWAREYGICPNFIISWYYEYFVYEIWNWKFLVAFNLKLRPAIITQMSPTMFPLEDLIWHNSLVETIAVVFSPERLGWNDSINTRDYLNHCLENITKIINQIHSIVPSSTLQSQRKSSDKLLTDEA